MDASCCYILNQDIYCFFLKAMHTYCTIDLLSLHVSVHPSATSRAQLAGSPSWKREEDVCLTKPDKYYTSVLHTASAPIQMYSKIYFKAVVFN